MANFRLHVAMVIATIVLFVAMLAINEWIFKEFEFAPGINGVYLPAGIRLLCTLLFAETGAIGLLIASWLVNFLYFFPNDAMRAFMGGILSSAAPYMVYKTAQRVGLYTSLKNFTSAKLLACAAAYALASPLLHHIWFKISGHSTDLLQSFAIMALGDLTGSLIVLYTIKLALSLIPESAIRAPA